MSETPREVRVVHCYPAALDLARDLGGDAVLVLHVLLAESRPDGAGGLVASVGTREIAARLGCLSKDTVHRRLRDLRRAGLIEVLPASVSLTTAPSYLLHLSSTGLSVCCRAACCCQACPNPADE